MLLIDAIGKALALLLGYAIRKDARKRKGTIERKHDERARRKFGG